MATQMKQDHMPNGVMVHLDSGGREGMCVKGVHSLDTIRYSGNCPFWNVDLYSVPVTDETDPAGEPRHICEFKNGRLKISKRTAPMPYTFRHVDADELHFVHKGHAKYVTEFGEVDMPTGRFLFLTRGVGYRVLPQSDEYMSVIFESEDYVTLNQDVVTAAVPLIRPTFRALENTGGQTEWEERLKSETWVLNAIRPFDPLETVQIRQDESPVFALDVDSLPAHSSTAPRPGMPFIIFRGPYFHLEIVMPKTAMPFYHRNVRANETQFVHYGNGDRFSALGHVDAPVGSLNNYPKGVEHRIGERNTACIGLIWETHGNVTLDPEIATK